MSIGDAIGEDPVGGYAIVEYGMVAAQGSYTYTGGTGTQLFSLTFGTSPGTIIISTTEDSYTSIPLSIISPNPPITWQWNLSPADVNSNFLIAQSGNSLNVAYVADTNLWNATITFLDNTTNFQTVTGFNSLPVESISQEITSMTTNTSNTMYWTLTVIATDANNNAITTSYTIKVEANYSINRDLLVAAVEERA